MPNVFKNIGQGTLKLKDGQGTPDVLTIGGIKGSGFSFTVTEERVAVMSRNVPIAWAKKKKQPVEIEFTIHYDEWERKTTSTGGDDCSVRDFMLGLYTGAQSVGDGGDFEFDIELTVADSGATGDESEVFLFENCVLEESSFSENEDTNEISFKVKALLEPTVTRS